MTQTGFPGYLKRSGFLEGILVLILVTSGIMGWGWLMQVTVKAIDIRGVENALPGEIEDLAGVDSGDVMFKFQTDAVEKELPGTPG